MNIRSGIGYLALVALCFAGGLVRAEEQPSATVTIEELQVMLILGGDHGHGTLDFQGSAHKFKANGLKLGGIGVHKMKMTGNVYELNRVEDFDGLYFAAEAGATFAKGVEGFNITLED